MNACEAVKAGDVVALIYGGWNASISRCTVERTTATTILVNGRTYNRHGQVRDRKDRYHAPRIEPWTSEHDADMRAFEQDKASQANRRLLRTFDWSNAKGEDVTAVVALMRERAML